MIVGGVPIKFSDVLTVIKLWLYDVLRFSFKKRAVPCGFTFVYFSYQPDFNYLKLSINSLIKHVPNITDIYIFVDQKAPFSIEEEQELSLLSPQIRFLPVNNFDWGSVASTKAEFDCFLKVSQHAKENDFLVKVDSDILFLKGGKFERLAYSNVEAIGDRHYVDYQYFQGGLYMIRHRHILKCFMDISLLEIEDIFKRWNNTIGEDVAVSQRLIDCNIKLADTRLMLFPDEYKQMTKANRFIRWEFAALHFVQDKENMQTYYDKFIH